MLLGFCALLFVLFYFLYCWLIFPLCWPLLLFSRSVMSDLQGPMDCRMPGFPVLHYFPEFAQTYVRLMFKLIESVMPSNHLILSHPLLFLPSIFPSIRIFSNELALFIRWPKYCSFSISPFNEYSGLISFRIDWFDLLAVQGILKSLLQHHSWKSSILWLSAFFMVNCHICTWQVEKT